MNQREKRLATVVGVVGGIVVAAKVVYPVAIKPVFDVEDEVRALEMELDEQLEERDRVEESKLAYKEFVNRTGDTDPMKVRNDVQQHLEQTIRKLKLESPDTRITPKKPSTDRKSGIHTVAMTMTVEGPLQPVVQFLEKCYELPYVGRFKDVKLSPASTKAKDSQSDRVKMTGTYNVLVLPKDPVVEDLIDFESLEQPPEVIKHSADAYAMIWDRKPFNEYVAPKPPPAERPTRDTTPTVVKQPKDVPEPPKRDSGDPDRTQKYVAGVMRYGVDELQIVHNRTKAREYVGKGQKLDGGELVYVHPYGGIVRKDDGSYFYEVGRLLSEAVPLSDAGDFPELQALAMYFPSAPSLPESVRDNIGRSRSRSTRSASDGRSDEAAKQAEKSENGGDPSDAGKKDRGRTNKQDARERRTPSGRNRGGTVSTK